MRPLLKWLGIIPLLAFYGFISGVICLLPLKVKTKRVMVVQVASLFSRIMLMLLGIRVFAKHPERLQRAGNDRLIVSNHLTYIDVLVISSLVPSIFVTSIELRNTTLLGPLARLSGSIFVERRKAAGLRQEIGQITHVLKQGMSVAFFPEGTTSNGDRVHPFKNSLFDAAVKTRADIVPVCLRYIAVNGERLTPLNRDDVFYYGGITFLKHLSKLLALKSVEVEVVPLPVIRVQAHHSRKELGLASHLAISKAYRG